MLNHTEMHSDNKMRESMKEGWVVRVEVGWKGRRRSREGGKNEPEKLLGWGRGEVKKTKRQTRKHSFVAHLEKMQVTNE